jgi:hypothetical protein
MGVKMKMKKITILAILFTFMLTAGAYAQTIWTHTAVKTASAKITDGRGYFGGIIITTDGTNNVTVDVRDATTAGTGTKLIPTTVILANERVKSISAPQFYWTGVYVTVTTSGTTEYVVYYEKR